MYRPVALQRPGWRSVVVCGSGPSFSEAQALQIVAARAAGTLVVLVVNDNWQRVPNADVLYACDGSWWNVHHAAIRAAAFQGELWTQDESAAARMGLRLIKQTRKLGLTQTERLIYGGGNSGHQAIQLAYLFGAEFIALVGFDMQADDDGKQHWFGEHPITMNRKLPFYVWIDRINSMAGDLAAAGVSVVNCSTRSKIECFPKADLATVLADWRAQALARSLDEQAH